jgi:hypothetical protein
MAIWTISGGDSAYRLSLSCFRESIWPGGDPRDAQFGYGTA